MYFTYHDFKLHYETAGSGKPVFMLHGMGCDCSLMMGCMERVFQKDYSYERIYIDLPGMGKSDAAIEFAAADRILELLEAFIRSFGADQFLLVGQSYGGYLARGILTRFPDRIEGLALVCPVANPIREKRSLPRNVYKRRDELFLNRLRAEERNDFCEYAVVADAYTFARYQKEILPGLKIADDRFAEMLNHNYVFSFDPDQEIAKLQFENPVLIICGKQDTCVGYHDQWKLTENFKRASFAVLDEAGHNLQIEQAELFEALIKNWLKRTEG